MREWKQTINFKSFWNEDSMSIVDKGKAAAAELKRVFPNWDDNDPESDPYEDISDFIDGFENDVAQSSEPVRMFDAILNDLYDWADENSVWVATNF